MKFRLIATAAIASLLCVVGAQNGYTLNMQCVPNQSVQAGPWPSGATYAVPYDGLVIGVSGNDINALEAAGCQLVGVSGYTMVAVLHGANMNVTTDQPFTVLIAPGKHYIPLAEVAMNCSVSLTTAKGQTYDAATKGGNALFGAAVTSVFTGCTGAGTDMYTAANAAGGSNIVEAQATAPILSLTTAQGAAATSDLYIFGFVF